jgi:hypothetical protein
MTRSAHPSIFRSLAPGLCALVLAAAPGCAPKSASPVASSAAQPPFSLGLAFDPTPPKVGDEHFTVTVRDGNGAPVTGAKVQVLPSYEAVPGGHLIAKTGMGGVSPTLDATDSGDGTYHAEMTIPKAIYWTFTVDAAIGDTRMTLQRGVQVQQ